MVPGARALLEALRERGMKMYLASGTDEIYMREEAPCSTSPNISTAACSARWTITRVSRSAF